MVENEERPLPPDPAPQKEEPSAEKEEPSAENTFASLFGASETSPWTQSVAVGDLVRGRVIAIGQATAFVAIGAKGEAVIDLTEFRDPETGTVHLTVGDELEATVVDDG